MELLLKIAAGGVSAALCAAVLRRSAPEFAVPIILACGAWILLLVAQELGQTIQVLSRLSQLARLEKQVVGPVIKVVGLSMVTRLGTEVCRSAGEGGIAVFVEIAGTILALSAALPLVLDVANLVVELLA